MPDIELMGATYPDVPAVDLPRSGGGMARFYDASGIDYASSPTSGGNADKANAILFGTVDSTSTATKFTATVEGLDELVDGTCIMLKNGVVTSTTNFTINVNGLGEKYVYTNLAAATRDTTIFNINYTMMFVYDSTRIADGAWICYRGYDANTNTIGYQLRTNSTVRNVSDTARYYKLYFTSADGLAWVPASVNSTNNATTARPVNQRPIDPFGRIVYTSANTNYTAGSNLAATTIWDQYALTLGYSFNRTDEALALTVETPVYVKCAPQSDGSAIMDADTPIVQALPSASDGKIYIFLGIAYSATAIELVSHHPVYWHDGSGIRIWTGSAGGSSVSPYTSNPAMDGTASAGSSDDYARGDHVHPTDTSRAASTHAHGDITSGGDITATAPTIASGDKLIINDESESKVTNGPAFGSDTTTFLRNDGQWAAPAGGMTLSTITVTLPVNGWESHPGDYEDITVSATGVTSTNTVFVAPLPSDTDVCYANGILCTEQGAGTLTFKKRISTLQNPVSVNVAIFG